MKRIFISSFALLIICQQLNAQFKAGDIELSFAGSLGTTTTHIAFGGLTVEKSSNYFSLFSSTGYYVMEGLAVESEIGMLLVEEKEPGYALLLGLSYNLMIPNTNSALFGRVGYGKANSLFIPEVGNVFQKLTKNFDVDMISITLGMKHLITPNIPLKFGINYRQSTYSEPFSSPSIIFSNALGNTINNKYSLLSAFAGFSILF